MKKIAGFIGFLVLLTAGMVAAEVKNHANFFAVAAETKSITNDLETLRQRIIRLTSKHIKVDYSDAVSGGYVTLDVDGQIDGLNFTPQEYLDAINMYNQILNLFNNIAVATGDYQATISNIADTRTP